KYILKENDIILARRGEMGRCGIVSANQAGWLCGSGSFLLRVNGKLDPKYARIFLSSRIAKTYLLKGSVGATMDNLNQAILASLPVPVPPKVEQAKILGSVGETRGYLSELELHGQLRLGYLNVLKQSVLKGVFG
ncbi:MAG TPA: restriction endonuclease subunit S, partial [Pyrinomonadaceae bacterium]|nr:restriction endonuclease subunit S [Pyrinomonadaceae bacterium]